MNTSIPEQILETIKNKGWWYEQPSQPYIQAINTIGIRLGAPICEFMAHAEDKTEFRIGGENIYQLGWHLLNTKLEQNSARLTVALGLPSAFILLSSFEGEGGYFYDRETEKVWFVQLGSEPINQHSWDSFFTFFQHLIEKENSS